MPPIQTLWNGKISDLEIMCLKSWIAHGHTVHLYSYESLVGIPPQVVLKDAREIIPEGQFKLYEGPTPKTKSTDAFSHLPFSDRFRFVMLRMLGGLWLDMDMVLIKPIPADMFAKPFFCASERTLQAGAYKSKELLKPAICALYVSEAESDLMVELVNCRMSDTDPWTGSKNFGKIVNTLGLREGVCPPSVFCDLNFWHVAHIQHSVSITDSLPSLYGWPGSAVTLPAEAIGIHLWRGLLRKRNVASARDVHPQSYLGRLYTQVEALYSAL